MAVDFSEKLGPLPVWGWGLIGGGVVIVGVYLLNRGGNDGGTVRPATIDASGYQTAGINGGSASIDTTTPYDNNVLWLTRASKQVAGSLSKSPADVYAALKKWLFGQEITTEEKTWVDTALGQLGSPPEGTQGISPVIPDAVTPKPTDGMGQPKIYYVDANKTWGMIFPGGRQVTTTDQATANRWGLEFGFPQAIRVTPTQYQDAYDAAKAGK